MDSCQDQKQLDKLVENPAPAAPDLTKLKCTDCRQFKDRDDGYICFPKDPEKGQQVDTFRCKCCNRVRGRVNRLANTRADLVNRFEKLEGEVKAKFLCDSADLLGADLKQCLEQCIVLSTRMTEKVRFKGNGQFRDKEFLDEKYKDRPEELQNIYKNARSMEHPDRHVQLWEDREFCVEEEKGEERMDERKRLLSTEEHIKPKKKAAAKRLAGAVPSMLSAPLEGDGQSIEDKSKKKPLPKAMAKKLTKKVTEATQTYLELGAMLAEAKAAEFRDHVPKAQMEKFVNLEEKFGPKIENAKTYIEENKADKEAFVSFVQDFFAQCELVDTAHEKLTGYLEEGREALQSTAAAGS